MGSPAAAAVVVAPILKLCDAYLDGHIPSCMSKCRMVSVNFHQVSSENPAEDTSLSGSVVRTASAKRVKACTGHVDELVGYIFMDCPHCNGSVLDWCSSITKWLPVLLISDQVKDKHLLTRRNP